jgi:hypothetical protein
VGLETRAEKPVTALVCQPDCSRLADGVQIRGNGDFMSRNAKKPRLRNTSAEDELLNRLMDDLAPRGPTVKVYRIGDDGKQTFLGATDLQWFSLTWVRDTFGGGKYLVRTVRSNGTYGPSELS